MNNCTIVIAVDREHLEELRCVWPTWQRWHPEICRPCFIIDGVNPAYLTGPDASGILYIHVAERRETQRDTMLWALLTQAPYLASGSHWLKIDTDTIAVGPGPPLTDFVTDDVQSIAACPWGYSTPRDSLERLETWYTAATGEPRQWTYHEVPQGMTRREFGKRLNNPNAVLYTPHEHRRAQERAWFPRVIGWISIINTAFSRRVAEFLTQNPPPFVSHDTLLWYLAERWSLPVQRIKYRSLGWDHLLGIRSIQNKVHEVMQGWEQQGQFAAATAPPRGWESTAAPDPAAIEQTPGPEFFMPDGPDPATTAGPQSLEPPPPRPRTYDPVLPFASKQPEPPRELPPLVVTIPSNGTAPPFPWKVKSNPAPVLYELLTSHFGASIVGAEIGVHQAATSHYLLQHITNLFLYMVDPWKEYADKSVLDGDKVSGASQALMDDAYKLAVERTKPYAIRRSIIRKTSIEASKEIQDNSLNFVFIDAAHGYESFCEDFRVWWPKVRSGGLLTGHDLGHRRFTGIRRGLDEMCGAMGLKYDVCPNTVWRLVKP